MDGQRLAALGMIASILAMIIGGMILRRRYAAHARTILLPFVLGFGFLMAAISEYPSVTFLGNWRAWVGLGFLLTSAMAVGIGTRLKSSVPKA